MEEDLGNGFFMDKEPPPLKLVSIVRQPNMPTVISTEITADGVAAHSQLDHGLVCGLCKLQSNSLEAYQKHVTGDVACASEFMQRGCPTCLLFFTSPSTRDSHARLCPSAMAAGFLQTRRSSEGMKSSSTDWIAGGVGSPSSVLESQFLDSEGPLRSPCSKGPAAIAVACETVGGGLNGSVDVLARVCVIDERENVLINTVVQPSLPVTTFRDTGLCRKDLEKGVPFRIVRRQLLSVLFTGSTTPFADLNAEPMTSAERRPRLLGHNLQHHLECLMIHYPEELLRDTATYPPLLKSCGSPNTLTALANDRLRLDLGACACRDLKKEALATLRLYHLFRTAPPGHKRGTVADKCSEVRVPTAPSFPSFERSLSGKARSASSVNASSVNGAPKQKKELKYYCWCLDGRF